MLFLTICFLIGTIQSLVAFEEGYYWREYTGTIPPDAIPGGQDINSKNVYIGQAYVQGNGLLVGEIYPGVKEVHVAINGIHKINSYIKILCGNPDNVSWSPVNATKLHLQLIDKRPIIGGHETGGTLYIGRVSFEGNIKIGKVVAFLPDYSRMFYNQNGVEKGIETYEILLYKGKDVDAGLGD